MANISIKEFKKQVNKPVQNKFNIDYDKNAGVDKQWHQPMNEFMRFIMTIIKFLIIVGFPFKANRRGWSLFTPYEGVKEESINYGQGNKIKRKKNSPISTPLIVSIFQ